MCVLLSVVEIINEVFPSEVNTKEVLETCMADRYTLDENIT